jgi:hypothetical protein
VITLNVEQRLKESTIDYSICTLVNDHEEYHRMVQSFWKNGFLEPRCEFLYIDNSEQNKHDGFSGLNLFLRAVRGKYIIVCHQDVELICDGIKELDDRIDELDRIDQKWALAGNAGGKYKGNLHDLAIRITDPHGANVSRGPLPCRVTSLDENFILVKASANLALSGNLSGFHLYAMDLSIIASVLGHNVYVIDFHLKHKSAGKIRRGEDLLPGEIEFDKIKKNLINKYEIAFSPKWYSSSVTEIFIRPKILLDFKYNFQCLIWNFYYSMYSFFKRLELSSRKYISVRKTSGLF